ncbi:nucleotidyltransferase [Thermococcus profundus]|uniref:protein adenylyltransferase n=1 Tax=Thermococcus profundus TaxID=49899 RepID=A0A2Z2M9U4_THEPR|nr:nucleotidyltransferase family protein [Thermococcus profundus]ASJ02526.1 nucleotidyltransferase [Thermococcus profundus]
MQTRRVRNLSDVQRILRLHRSELRRRFGVKRIGIFGSYSRGEQKPESDVDILVEFESPIGMIDFIRLQEYLESLLGVRVDLVTPQALKKRIKEHVLREVKYL